MYNTDDQCCDMKRETPQLFPRAYATMPTPASRQPSHLGSILPGFLLALSLLIPYLPIPKMTSSSSQPSSVPPAADTLCVFCGSSPGNDPIYTRVAEQVGQAIAQQKWRMVYGGGNRGVMGTVAQSVLANGGHVLGVIPSVMASSAPSNHPTESNANGGGGAPVSQEGAGPQKLNTSEIDDSHQLMQTRVVSSMHERKALMAKESQRGFVALPGGFGTFEEVLEMVTWSQLGIHNLPIVVPNVAGFWSPLRQLVTQATQSGFITHAGLELMTFIEQDQVDSQYARPPFPYTTV